MTLNPERINPFSNKEKSEKEYKFSYDDRDFVPAEAVLKSESRDWPNGFVIIHRSDKSKLFFASKEKDTAETGLSEFNKEVKQEISEKIENNDVLILAGPTNSGKTNAMQELHQQYPTKYSGIYMPNIMDTKNIKECMEFEIICLTEIMVRNDQVRQNIIKFLGRDKKIIFEMGGCPSRSAAVQIEYSKAYLKNIAPYKKVDSVAFGIQPLNVKQTEEYLRHMIEEYNIAETAIVHQNIANIGKASENSFIIFKWLHELSQSDLKNKIFSPSEWKNQIERWWRNNPLVGIALFKLEDAKEIADAKI